MLSLVKSFRELQQKRALAQGSSGWLLSTTRARRRTVGSGGPELFELWNAVTKGLLGVEISVLFLFGASLFRFQRFV